MQAITAAECNFANILKISFTCWSTKPFVNFQCSYFLESYLNCFLEKRYKSRNWEKWLFFGNDCKKVITEKVLSFVPLIAVSFFDARKDGVVLFYKLLKIKWMLMWRTIFVYMCLITEENWDCTCCFVGA